MSKTVVCEELVSIAEDWLKIWMFFCEKIKLDCVLGIIVTFLLLKIVEIVFELLVLEESIIMELKCLERVLCLEEKEEVGSASNQVFGFFIKFHDWWVH